ncbi:MAG: hypothetical protein IKR04_05885 [Clostridia bacterium]|nr:hypothetical protein [Clostridia bacterium]
MREFQVYYSGLYIGRLVINEEGKYYYALNDHFKTICFFEGKNVAPALYTEQNDFGDPIPYFQVRIEANDKHRGLEIGLVTDEVRLKEVY